MKRLFPFLFCLLVSVESLSVHLSAQESIERTQDTFILERFFQTVPKNTVDSLMIRAALFFRNTPYAANTLEANEEEQLVVNLRELDCTTFVENCLVLARAMQYPDPDYDRFKQELRKIRYRNGVINGYTSRLHYTFDWIFNNIEKGIMDDITYALGGKKLKPNVFFMSQNPAKYPSLAGNPDEVQRIQAVEQKINARGNYYYIPKQEISHLQPLIKNGDIICFTTSIPGLDISHLAIAYRNKGQLAFIHASPTAKKVIINPEPLSDYCRTIKTNTGIMVLRPLPVNVL